MTISMTLKKYGRTKKDLSLSDLDLRGIWRKNDFRFKGIVVADVKIKYTTQITSNNGKIDLNIGENCSFHGCWLVLLLYVPSQQLWSLRDGQFT